MRAIQEDATYTSAADFVMMTCAAVAKSDSVIMGKRVAAHDQRNMMEIVLRTRRMFVVSRSLSRTDRGKLQEQALLEKRERVWVGLGRYIYRY